MAAPRDHPLGIAVGAAGILVLIAFVLLVIGWSQNFSDTICFDNSHHFSETSQVSAHPSYWPLGTACTLTTGGGKTVQYFIVDWPGLHWAVASLLLAACTILGSGVFAAIRSARRRPPAAIGQPAP
jgi:hypothetical protein